MNIENDFLTDFDLFGKLPELYYKGKSKKSSILGIVLTVIYIVLYIAFLIYKLVRMFKRQDVNFSETNSSTGGLPKIHLTKEILTYGLALANYNQEPFIDESIYYPTAYLTGKKIINGKEEPVNEEIKFGICTIDDFGDKYKAFASKYNLSNFYCFKNFDVELEGYSSAENNTYIQIFINRCTDPSPKGIDCKAPETIESALNNQNLFIFSEDFDITPYDYEHPVKE